MDISINIPSFFVDLIRGMDNYINESLRTLQDEFSISILLVFILISFLYGFIHSAGPGHGKTIISTFFLKEKHPIVKAVILSSIVSIIHTGSSIILAILFNTILSGIKGFFRIKLQSYFILSSGILITIIGIFFLIFKVFLKEKKSNYNKNRNIFLIGIAAGIIPCPVALVIMLFAISNNIIIYGLISIISISLGMFILLILIGILSIKLHDSIIFLSKKHIHRTEIISKILEYFSITAIITIGIFMTLKILIK